MRLSILIVNWKVRDLLRACLRSVLEEIGDGGQEIEIIVVDNDSRDGSVEMVHAEFPGVGLIPNDRNAGFGAANDQGYQISRGACVLLLNPDTIVTGGAVGHLLDFMDRHPRVGAVGCRLLNTDGSLQRWTGGAFPNLANVACHYLFLDRLLPAGWRPRPLFLDRDAQEDLDVGWVSGACMMLRREAVGARIFDPRFFLYGEDLELCYRLRRSGWGVVYTPTASIVHHQGASMKQQAGEIMLSSLKGPRYFLLQTRSRAEVMFIDLLTLMGFGLRGILYGIAAVLRPGRGYAAKAESSLHYLGVAFRVMRT